MYHKILFASLFLFSTHAFAANFQCFGTEPFWNASVSEDAVDIEMMGGVEYENEITSLTGALGYQSSFIRVYSNFRGPVATLKEAKCNDGMSDRVYRYETIIFTDQHTLYGCCQRVRSRK